MGYIPQLDQPSTGIFAWGYVPNTLEFAGMPPEAGGIQDKGHRVERCLPQWLPWLKRAARSAAVLHENDMWGFRRADIRSLAGLERGLQNKGQGVCGSPDPRCDQVAWSYCLEGAAVAGMMVIP